MAIREGAWDCTYCGQKRNRGPHKFCAACGAPRGKDVEFYLPEGAAEVTDAGALAAAYAGPDWTCGSCGGDNHGGARFCGGCGAGRDGGAARPVREVPGADVVGARAREPAMAAAFFPGDVVLTPTNLARGGLIGCIAVAGLLVTLIGAAAFAPRSSHPSAGGDAGAAYDAAPQPPPDLDETLTVAAVRWERAITIERLTTLTEEGWQGTLPADARVTAQRQEVHHRERVQVGTQTRTRNRTERVKTGTERVQAGTKRVQIGTRRVKSGVRNLGNGYFEDVYKNEPIYERQPVFENRSVYRDRTVVETYQEPVYEEQPRYQTKCTYQVDRWVAVRTEKSAGTDGTPQWPPVTLAGQEREGARAESYAVDLTGLADVRRTLGPLPLDRWLAFKPGARVQAKVSPQGEIRTAQVVVEPAPAPAPGPAGTTPAEPLPAERAPGDPAGAEPVEPAPH